MELKSWCGGLMMSLAGMNFPLAAPYALFNGVRLPRLPYWDILRYPFAYIKKAPTGYNLSAMNVLAYLEDGNITTGGAVNTLIWNCTDGKTWVKDGDEHTYSEYYWSEGMHIWSNVAIGTKYPGTKPVPDYGGASTDDREPIAYSYNGVILPALPELPQGYMCSAICNDTKGEPSVLLFTNKTLYEKNECVYIPFGANVWMYELGNGEWITDSYLVFVWDVKEQDSDGFAIVWTNTDILNENGSVYLAASEPVPVYE